VEHRLKIEGRAADHLKHVGGGSLLLERFAQLGEQPRVLNGDDGLRGEVRHQLDLFIGKWQNALAVNRDCADEIVFLEHRNQQQRASSADVRELDNTRTAIA